MTLLTIKPWLALALIFVLGTVTGVSLTIGLRPYFAPPMGMPQMKSQLEAKLTQRLGLTPDQQARIDPILTDQQKQIQGVRREEFGRIAKIVEDSNKQILPILTAGQQTEFQRIEKEMENQREQRMGRMHHAPGGSSHNGMPKSPTDADDLPPPPPMPPPMPPPVNP